jgi:hypothetical protein
MTSDRSGDWPFPAPSGREEGDMRQGLYVVFELPDEKEVRTRNETCQSTDPLVIKKTIHYKNGLIVVLYQDFQGSVFAVEIRSGACPFWIMGKQLILTC